MTEKAELAKRDDISKLNIEELLLRRAIKAQANLAVIEYQYQREGMWFDAFVWIIMDNGDWKHAFIDLIPQSSNDNTHAMMKRKREYAEANDIPLLQIKANSATRNVMWVWVMKERLEPSGSEYGNRQK